jgi:Uri superfamily endonuclease
MADQELLGSLLSMHKQAVEAVRYRLSTEQPTATGDNRMLSDQLESDRGDGRPGTYAMLLAPETVGGVRIGRLGTLDLTAGVFVYVGSALGAGGIAARCRHHRRISVRPHWHLDYLRPHCRILGVWAAYGRERLEHRWASILGALPDACWPLLGFGASDCRCPAHLIWLAEVPTVADLARLLGHGVLLEEVSDAV